MNATKRFLTPQGILSVFFLMTVGFLSLSCQPQIVTTTRDFNVGPGKYEVIPMDLKKDDLLEVSITVRGGNDVGVRIEDPAGRAVVSQRVQSQNFTVRAREDGRHAVVLDNTSFLDLFAGKVVTLVLKYPQR